MPFLDGDKVKCIATIASVTPLSKRPKRRKTALLTVHVEFAENT